MFNGFRLSKWYLDCIDEAGTGVIAYVARLSVGTHALAAASLLVVGPDGPTASSAWTGIVEPVVDGDTIRLELPSLGLAGSWARREPAFSRRLLERSDGFLDWHCLQPRSEACVVAGGRTIRGSGYVERVELTLPPWELPLETLRWGRALSASGSVVWIDWSGPVSFRLVLVDGRECPVRRIDDEGVEAEGVCVRFESPRVLRAGPLGTTAFATVPVLRELLPVRLLAVVERKWLGRAVIERGGGVETGSCIHEVVTWP